jgi:single-strand DNA-binding protein
MAHITVIGNLTREPELRFSQDGKAVLKFGVAENFARRQPDGSYKGPTKFHNVVVFGNYADSLGQRLAKGMPVTVIGETTMREYEKDGETRTAEEIKAVTVFPHRKLEASEAPAPAPAASAEDDLEDLPF